MGAGDESICKKWKQFTGNLKNPHRLILNLCSPDGSTVGDFNGRGLPGRSMSRWYLVFSLTSGSGLVLCLLVSA